MRKVGEYAARFEFENLRLSELAGEGCYECVLVVLPLKIRGATASVVHPIALG